MCATARPAGLYNSLIGKSVGAINSDLAETDVMTIDQQVEKQHVPGASVNRQAVITMQNADGDSTSYLTLLMPKSKLTASHADFDKKAV